MTKTGFLDLAPMPKKLSYSEGFFSLSGKRYIKLDAADPESLIVAATRIGIGWETTSSSNGARGDVGLVIRLDESLGIDSECYSLNVTSSGIDIVASDAAGAFYGACTLAQILRQCNEDVPCLSISDQPDFPARGVMIDVSRDKVPTMETLYSLIDMFAGWKINQLQLYTEHTFAYEAHPVVWAKASPITGEEILALDAYCKSRFIDLVPNQNSFGHMERWLKHDEYKPMAECPDGFDAPWGHADIPTTLCPVDERTVRFVGSLYDELLPHFTSRLFNVGCDETWELGKGRSSKICELQGVGQVYLRFLVEIHRMTQAHGRTMMFWGDIVKKHPELIPMVPKEAIALEWGYEYDHPFGEQGAKFKDAAIQFYVCPGVSSTASFAGRTENVIANITNAARNGLEQGAIGLLNTCWADMGGWQPLSASYLGVMVGAMASWNSSDDIRDRLLSNLSIHAFGDATGKIAKAFYDLGNSYLIFKHKYMNQSVPWHLLLLPEQREFHEIALLSEYEELEDKLEEISAEIKDDEMTVPDAQIIREELKHITNILGLAAYVGKLNLGSGDPANLEAMLKEVKDYHSHVWLLRNRPGGLQDSLARLRIDAASNGRCIPEHAMAPVPSAQHKQSDNCRANL